MTKEQLIADLVACLEYKEDMAHVQVIEGKGAVFWETMYALKRAAHEPSERLSECATSPGNEVLAPEPTDAGGVPASPPAEAEHPAAAHYRELGKDCDCHAPGGYPHEPDCKWWNRPSQRT